MAFAAFLVSHRFMGGFRFGELHHVFMALQAQAFWIRHRQSIRIAGMRIVTGGTRIPLGKNGMPVFSVQRRFAVRMAGSAKLGLGFTFEEMPARPNMPAVTGRAVPHLDGVMNERFAEVVLHVMALRA